MNGGCPPALLAPAKLLQALANGPSRADVALWVQHWQRLDEMFERGHTLRLEETLFHAVDSGGRCSFRAAWSIALLTEAEAMKSTGLSGRLYGLLQGAGSFSLQRELMRALLMLSWSPEQLYDLTQWALDVVFLDDMPLAALHHSLKVMERRMNTADAPMSPGLRAAIEDSLSHVRRTADSAHAKKKAALLMARLSE